jgi:CDP-diacylglycerol---glycerol-3-phosphate 3-phosphatidyltransferase
MGKLKTITQIAMVLVLIAVEDRTLPVDILVWVTVIVTVASGVDYFFNFRSLLQARPSSHSRVET